MGKLTAMQCPNCGASIALEENNHRIIYCPYCASPLDKSDDALTININKNIKKEQRSINYTKIAELEYKERENKRENRTTIGIFVFGFLGLFISLLFLAVPAYIRDNKDKAIMSTYIEQGYVCPGKSAKDYIDENINSVVKQLESVGFTNIEKVAIGGGLAVWDWGKVTEVMINGNTDFGRYACFPPDAPIVVTYK